MKTITSNGKMFAGLVTALVIWGIYLAIGATGYFADAFNAKTSLTKSLIVIACVTAFLGLWGGFELLRQRKPTVAERGVQQANWSWSSMFSLLCIAIGIGLWSSAIFGWTFPPTNRILTMGWLAIASMGTANVAALIGLSDPRPRRGKIAAIASLIALLICVVVFFARSSSSA